MNYVKKTWDRDSEEQTRTNLSTREDARIPGSDLSNARLLPVPQCDWCGEERPAYVYAASRTSAGENSVCWRWATCERCNRMVENSNWDSLHRKMVARFKRFFALRLAVDFKGRPVPDSLVNEAVYQAMDDFHKYAIKQDDPNRDTLIANLPGAGKSE